MSLSKKLTLSLSISLLAFFALQAVMVGVEMRELSEDNMVINIEDDMEGLLTTINHQADLPITIISDRVPEIFNRPFSGHYFQIHHEEHIISSRSLWDSQLPQLKAGTHRDISGPIGQQLLVVVRDYVIHGKSIRMSVAEDTSSLDATAWHLQRELLELSFAALLILMLLQIWVIRYGFKPLALVCEEIQQLERGETDKLIHPVPSEIQPLVQEVNHLLQVMQQRMQRSRHALGNLSHALKTPLSVMMQILERHQHDADTQALLVQTKTIENHINRELTRARTAGITPGGTWQNPEEDIRDLARTLEVAHQERVVVHLHSFMTTHWFGDREDMMEVLGNLIDNACKWAKSEVVISIRSNPDNQINLTIEDDGPGMSEADQDNVMKRGQRLDESKPGHGLGLSIVLEIIDIYGGNLRFSTSENLGGLKVSMQLPPHQPYLSS